ncbi:HNH endonuclease [Streptococcus pneumoniae]
MKDDYRNTRYCVSNNNIVSDKNALENKIKSEHRRAKIIYNQINKKDSEYNKIFRNIYNNKCAYCGITTDVISSELFEIDHFVCEASFNGDSINAGKINNLVLACKKCNRAKKDFIWDKGYSSKFNTDDKSITKLFYRDKDYYIRIEKKFTTDTTICNFHRKLKLYEEIRRLDFLLMNMHGFYNKYFTNINSDKISKCIVLLQQKRNKL